MYSMIIFYHRAYACGVIANVFLSIKTEMLNDHLWCSILRSLLCYCFNTYQEYNNIPMEVVSHSQVKM